MNDIYQFKIMNNKLEKTQQFLNQLDENILKMLKESNVDTYKRTLPRGARSKDYIEKLPDDFHKNSRIFNDLKIGSTPKSFDQSELNKSHVFDNLNNTRLKNYAKTHTFDKQPPPKPCPPSEGASATILERLKQIELHYQSKINILEDDNAHLRRHCNDQKQQILQLEQRLHNEEQQVAYLRKELQDQLSKAQKDAQEHRQSDLKHQEQVIGKKYDKILQKKDIRIKELEQLVFNRKNFENPLFTFKTQEREQF